MDALSGGSGWALAFAIITAAVLWWFKTPRQMSDDVNERVDILERAHHALDVRTSIAETRLTAEIKHLAETISELSRTLKESDRMRSSGRHNRSQ